MTIKTANLVLLAAMTASVALPEPAPRKPVELPLRIDAVLPHVSGVAELSSGRLIVSDAKTPRVWIIAPDTGVATTVGSPGAGPGQYARPGGFYGTPETGMWMVDRGMARAVSVSPTGTLGESRSVVQRGSSASSDTDYDVQRVDGLGSSYFISSAGLFDLGRAGMSTPMVDLVRLAPDREQSTVVAQLQQRATRTRSGGDGVVLSQSVIGSPADGWGVTADGRVAVVRAAPYRVDWFSPDGRETKGPVYDVDVIPMTEADRQAYAAKAGGASVGRVSGTSGAPATAANETLFAETKPPFDPNLVLVSASGRVFVERSRPAGQTEVTCDVFDRQGRRVDRIVLPAGSRIVGASDGHIYVRETAASGSVALKKYEVK